MYNHLYYISLKTNRPNNPNIKPVILSIETFECADDVDPIKKITAIITNQYYKPTYNQHSKETWHLAMNYIRFTKTVKITDVVIKILKSVSIDTDNVINTNIIKNEKIIYTLILNPKYKPVELSKPSQLSTLCENIYTLSLLSDDTKWLSDNNYSIIPDLQYQFYLFRKEVETTRDYSDTRSYYEDFCNTELEARTCVYCSQTFPNRYYLLEHIQTDEHNHQKFRYEAEQFKLGSNF